MDKTPTKDRILDSALTLFSEKGYDGVGVDLIAENAEQDCFAWRKGKHGDRKNQTNH